MMARAQTRSSSDLMRTQMTTPVGPRDQLVMARVVAVVALAAVSLWVRAGDGAVALASFLLVLAAAQPLLGLGWPDRRVFFFRQNLTDVAAFAIIVAIAPEYYWMAALVLVGVIGYFAVESDTRPFGVLVGASVVAMSASGWIREVEDWERAVVIATVVWVGLGFLGRRTRQANAATRADLLYAIGQAGGIAHLTEVDGQVVDALGDIESVTGWPRNVWFTRDHRELIHPDDLGAFWVDRDDLHEGVLLDRVARFRTPDGRWVWLRDMSRVVENAGRLYLRGFWIDVTAEYGGVERANEQATTDSLTGLRNRRYLLSELDRRSGRTGHHLVLIDLNRFKDVNDTLGHDAGDDLLTTVAQRLSACVRPGDVLARLGGDEFAIVIDDAIDASSVAAIVDRFAFEVGRPVELSGVAITTSLSAGIAPAGPDPSGATMLRHADIAMYEAKRTGRTSAVFDEPMEADSDRRATLSAGLATALDTEELALHFQPIIDLESGCTVALEGLARWDHPLFGQIAPNTFLDVALMSQSSGRFTQVMVQRAIDALVALSALGNLMPVAVNVPIRVLEDASFAAWVDQECRRAGTAASMLVFEVAEVDLHDSGSMPLAIERLVAIGATISIDDFGAGNATFERLRWRNVEQLKLDRSVVEDAAAHDRERSILRSILRLADELGYSVVAEGVESAEQVELLQHLGCRLAQGYHFARPQSLDHVLELVASERHCR